MIIAVQYSQISTFTAKVKIATPIFIHWHLIAQYSDPFCQSQILFFLSTNDKFGFSLKLSTGEEPASTYSISMVFVIGPGDRHHEGQQNVHIKKLRISDDRSVLVNIERTNQSFTNFPLFVSRKITTRSPRQPQTTPQW